MLAETQISATTGSQYGSERRHPRFFLSAPVMARRPLNSGSPIARGITLEISLGGLSAVLCGPPPVGERVSVQVKLPNLLFETPAIVRHSTSARTGFQFVSLSPEHRLRIANCIERSHLCPWPKETGFQLV
jgi:c-di-GMP-binding flagellar brake protein YcgR